MSKKAVMFNLNEPVAEPEEIDTDDDEDEEKDKLTELPNFASVASTAQMVKKRFKKPDKIKVFERRYTELGPFLKGEQKRIDYVLVYPKDTSEEEEDRDKKKSLEEKEFKRECFENALLQQGFSIQKDIERNDVFVKLHCPFKRLCMEAEIVKLEMRLKGCAHYEDPPRNFLERFEEKYLETDDEVDFISAPFLMDRIQLYEDYEDPTNFFRPSVRSLLVDHILMNTDIREKADKKKHKKRTKSATSDTNASIPEKDDEAFYDEENACVSCCKSCKEGCMSFICCQKLCNKDEEANVKKRADAQEDKLNRPMQKWGLPYLLMKKVYTDSFILHEESKKSKEKEELHKEFFDETEEEEALQSDPRKDLDETWTVPYKYQPLWKIRNYFGEKIALYFAWSGTLITSLWIPTLVGLAIFFYGLYESSTAENTEIQIPVNASVVETLKIEMSNLLNVIKLAFDNEATVYFAILICLWGTVFLEVWKRKSATLAYEWDVDMFDANEPDRPQFFGIKVKKDPVTSEWNWFYPVKRQFLKYFCSVSMLLFFVTLVFASLVGVIVYRVILSVDVCPDLSSVQCLIITTIFSSVLNAVSILLLGRIYDRIAIKLTDWENHRTQSKYDDALVLKLFAFQFANSYASCIYIAFFRGKFDVFGVFGLGSDYRDNCSGSCMSQLSFQVLVLMLAKPFPKFLKDIILPFLRKLWRVRPKWCCRCRCCPGANKVENCATDQEQADKQIRNSYIKLEKMKPSLGDFTLGEYTEKIIQYGFLMLFAASFPLAPLLALVTNLVDIRVDAKRMLWWYRRPVGYIRKDIGRWYGILEFVNTCGVISTGFLIAFTSSWGNKYDTTEKVWIVVIFEHVVFGIKFILAYMIPDVPSHVNLSIRREKFQVARILEVAKAAEPVNYATLVPKHSKNRKKRSSNYESFTVNGVTPGGKIEIEKDGGKLSEVDNSSTGKVQVTMKKELLDEIVKHGVIQDSSEKRKAEEMLKIPDQEQSPKEDVQKPDYNLPPSPTEEQKDMNQDNSNAWAFHIPQSIHAYSHKRGELWYCGNRETMSASDVKLTTAEDISEKTKNSQNDLEDLDDSSSRH